MKTFLELIKEQFIIGTETDYGIVTAKCRVNKDKLLVFFSNGNTQEFEEFGGCLVEIKSV